MVPTTSPTDPNTVTSAPMYVADFARTAAQNGSRRRLVEGRLFEEGQRRGQGNPNHKADHGNPTGVDKLIEERHGDADRHNGHCGLESTGRVRSQKVPRSRSRLGTIGRITCDGRVRSIQTLFVATRLSLADPSGSPVLKFRSKWG